MKNIRVSLPLTLVALLALWWIGDPAAHAAPTHWLGWRNLAVQATGVLAIGTMSAALVLALRPRLLEPWFGGLDKMYRLHKWLGIAALATAVLHWLASQTPKWLVGLGLLQPPQRGPRAQIAGEPLREFFMAQRGNAEGLGEWAFYAAAVLIVLALVKRFPYRYFFKTHRLLAIAFLVLAWHAMVLLSWESWPGVLGVGVALMLAAGVVASLRLLLRRTAAEREVVGEVEQVIRHDALGVVELVLAMKGRWPGHAAGQFAFLTLHDDEGPHPFTLTSAWKDDGRIDFIIKGLGDYTRTLAERVKPGDVARVEGPYGRFDFERSAQRQIWIGGGIGITPFIARMKALAAAPDGRKVDLFHTTKDMDPNGITLLERDAAAAGVRLHVLWDERDGLLNAQRLVDTVPDWRDADLWFCGPAGFGRALRRELVARGLPEARFHQELFEMR
ncbi:MAG TPA: ferric reductase-like transmembrane domain-containing protein [Rubrivivax sp.]|nr:ferric reductase-like transmembrane domain-containing protein [Rubrivivax sp.]